MESWVWQTMLIVIGGTFLLRLAGRKSISQMTISQTVIMIALGSLMIQPVSNRGYWAMFGTASVLVLTMIAMEYLQLKFNPLERLFTGSAKSVIENGQINEANLAKMRLTIDRLEMRLRQHGVASLSDVKHATLEVSGLLGYELHDHKKPATKEDLYNLYQLLENRLPPPPAQPPASGDLFTEVINGQNQTPPPQHLQ